MTLALNLLEKRSNFLFFFPFVVKCHRQRRAWGARSLAGQIVRCGGKAPTRLLDSIALTV
jgi:hypothetical protein